MNLPPKKSLDRKMENESCSNVFLARASSIIFVQLHDSAQFLSEDHTNIKAKSRTLLEFVELGETAEYILCLLRRDAGSGVLHIESNISPLFSASATKDNLTFEGVFARICQIIDYNLLDTLGI